jgi:ferric-dicitrate binding protein FerR (iron transport regulator)
MNDLNKWMKELLEKDQWTDEEKRILLNYLETSDTTELESLMEQQYYADSQESLDPSLSDDMLQVIHKKIIGEEQTAKIKRLPWLKKLAVAASLIFAVGVGVKFFMQDDRVVSVAKNAATTTEKVKTYVRHITNNTGKEEKITLPDCSLVLLARNSELTYSEPFITSRDINITGKGYFKVAKDAYRPFTVVSGAVATTVLGTDFLVTAYAKESKLSVRLYNGKVVVKPVNKGDWRMKKDFYLKPGEEFIYQNEALAKVNVFKRSNDDDADENDDVANASNVAPVLPFNASGNWYMFNNQSLSQVLDQLSAIYDVKINYNKDDVRRKYFVGKFNKTDSLDIILKYILKVNDLNLLKKDNQYFITK